MNSGSSEGGEFGYPTLKHQSRNTKVVDLYLFLTNWAGNEGNWLAERVNLLNLVDCEGWDARLYVSNHCSSYAWVGGSYC